MKVGSVLERKELATILAFGVEVTPEAQQLSDELGVNIFTADTLNNLCRMFKSYIDILKGRKKREAYEEEVVFPCVVKILDTDFDANDRFALRIDVLEGIAKVGNPLCIPQRGFINIGRIAAIRDINDKPVDLAKKGQVVTIKIVGTSPEEQQIEFCRHFKIDDVLVSHISRRSIDVLKAYYRDDLSPEDWRLVNKLKCIFKIP
ncbi:eukaryotic translation initiation factor 5B [Morus notabilis]|nr:eukaryotic translation initiation factor 5B [Morus notabilis]